MAYKKKKKKPCRSVAAAHITVPTGRKKRRSGRGPGINTPFDKKGGGGGIPVEGDVQAFIPADDGVKTESIKREGSPAEVSTPSYYSRSEAGKGGGKKSGLLKKKKKGEKKIPTTAKETPTKKKNSKFPSFSTLLSWPA